MPKVVKSGISFVLINLPSDHEIEDTLVTECEVIRSILLNRDDVELDRQVEIVTAITAKSLRAKTKRVEYPGAVYVHLATHGDKKGILLFDGRVIPWPEVATMIKRMVQSLRPGQSRVLCLSCCCSSVGYKALRIVLGSYFSGIYYFHKAFINFATATTVWSMFYRRKTLKHPTRKLAKRVNDFFAPEKVLVYNSI